MQLHFHSVDLPTFHGKKDEFKVSAVQHLSGDPGLLPCFAADSSRDFGGILHSLWAFTLLSAEEERAPLSFSILYLDWEVFAAGIVW